jgi:hypothetical protein
MVEQFLVDLIKIHGDFSQPLRICDIQDLVARYVKAAKMTGLPPRYQYHRYLWVGTGTVPGTYGSRYLR